MFQTLFSMCPQNMKLVLMWTTGSVGRALYVMLYILDFFLKCMYFFVVVLMSRA